MSKRAKDLVAAGRGGGEPPERPKKTPRATMSRVSPTKRALWLKEADRHKYDEEQKAREYYWRDESILGVSLSAPMSTLRAEHGTQIARIARHYGATLNWRNISNSVSLGEVLESWRGSYLERIQPTINALNDTMPDALLSIVLSYSVGSVRDDMIQLFRNLRPVPPDWQPENLLTE